MYCYCCNDNYAGIFTSLCPRCHRIRHLISVYGDRVLDVLEKVLVRSESGQTHKIKTELKVEKNKIDTGEEETTADNKDSVLTRSKSKYTVE